MNTMTKTQFHYPDYGVPSSFPEHIKHSGQECKVLYESSDRDPEVERIFVVRFSDGIELEAFHSELTTITIIR